ncbi:hypothetical protein WJ542_21720 [Paraburkholderia sp. B3]|uniref:hypothetical protein n=1 Tax=Paraburkholderia sp. B3 TaxID=3134791 RepID=UPI003981A494
MLLASALFPRLRMTVGIALLALMLPLSVRAEGGAAPTHVYTGTIGKQPVVMKLTHDGDAPTLQGQYFYAKFRFDLPLSGREEKNGHVSLTEDDNQDGTHQSQIDLDRQGDGSLRGQWTSGNGKVLPVVLTPATLPGTAPADDYLVMLEHKDLYEYLRLAGLKLQDGKRVVFMGHTLQWRVEPVSHITFPVVEDGYPDAQRETINRVLRARLWQEVSGYFDCMSGGKLSSGGSVEQTVTPSLMNDRVISLDITTDSFCGGAHPDVDSAPLTLDVRDGRALTLEDVLWVGAGKPMRFHSAEPGGDPGSDFDALDAYRQHYLAPWLLQQLTALDPATFKKTDDDCPLAEADTWTFPVWLLTPKGMSVTPTLPHAIESCTNTWILPWSVLRAHPGVVAGIVP